MTTVRLMLGDCLELLKTLPAGSVDAVVTDPVWPNCPIGLLPGSDGFQENLLRDALEVVTAKRVVVVLRYDSDPRFLIAVPARWPFFRAQVLPHIPPGYNGRKLGGIEIAYCFGEPITSRDGQRVIPGIGPTHVTCRTERDVGHPCPRSEEHMTWLTRWWSEPGETVLDPFMGSGTTGVACVKTGRNFIGMEIDPTYFAIAEKRIADAQLQMPLFDEVSSPSDMR